MCCLGLLVSWFVRYAFLGLVGCWFDCCFGWFGVVRPCCTLLFDGLLMVWGLAFRFDFGRGRGLLLGLIDSGVMQCGFWGGLLDFLVWLLVLGRI